MATRYINGVLHEVTKCYVNFNQAVCTRCGKEHFSAWLETLKPPFGSVSPRIGLGGGRGSSWMADKTRGRQILLRLHQEPLGDGIPVVS